MVRRVRPLAGATLGGLLVIAACSFEDPNVRPGGTAGAGGAGGGGHAGESSSTAGNGGRSGSATTEAGSSGKGGRGGSGQTSGGSGGVSGGGVSGSGTHETNGGAGGAVDPGDPGGAGGAPACPGCASGVCLEGGECVACLASKDRCPMGQYCTDAHECVSGCKSDGSSCASGVCNDQHDCAKCIDDSECKDDLVCGDGQCGSACSAAQEGQQAACGAGLTCCSLHCSKLEVDSRHCGACGANCDADQFCGSEACADPGAGGVGGASSAPCVACQPTTLASICAIARAIVILDTNKNDTDGNRTPGRAIGAALAAKCTPTPTLSEAEQDGVEALNLTTGRPVSGGGELLVVAGGPFYQNLEGYVEEQHIAPLYWKVAASGDAAEYRRSADDSLVVSLPIADDHESHDFFIVQFMRDSASGSLVLNAQGFWQSGTVAAAFQITEGMLPALSSFDKAWYAYEWTDMNGDKAPDLNEFSQIDSE